MTCDRILIISGQWEGECKRLYEAKWSKYPNHKSELECPFIIDNSEINRSAIRCSRVVNITCLV